MKKKVIPIYMNQRIVFDLLAIIEDGFSKMYSVQRKETDSNQIEASINGEIGTSNVFSFISAKLSAKLGGKQDKGTEENISEERIHTPTSLFAKLLEYLESETKSINTDEDYNSIQAGDFITFQASIKENSLIKLFDSFSSLFSLANLFETKSDNKTPKNDNKKTAEQIKGLADSMRLGGIIDLICDLEIGKKVVLQSETRYFENQFIGVIEEGEYTILGKVIKSSKSEDDCINLLRNTSLSMAKDNLISTLIQSLNSQQIALAGLMIGNIESKINGPLIIPIAIYA